MNKEPDGQANYDGQGGSYVVDGDQHALVERTKQLHEVQTATTTAVIDPNDPDMMARIAAGTITKIEAPNGSSSPVAPAVRTKPTSKRGAAAGAAESTTTE